MSDRDMRRQYEAGSPGQRRTDAFVRRIATIVAIIAVVLIVVSLYFLVGLRQPGMGW